MTRAGNSFRVYRDRDIDRFNAEVPPGTPVTFWRLRDPWRDPVETVTRSVAWALGHGDGVVLVDGIAGGVCIGHVEVRS